MAQNVLSAQQVYTGGARRWRKVLW